MNMDMDISDEVLQAGSSRNGHQQQPDITVLVDDAHPFDLEAYISSYTGRAAVDRLVHIISACPSVAPQALQLATQQIYQLRDPSLYHAVVSAYERIPPEQQLQSAFEIAPFDTRWQDETLQRNAADRMKLEVELKTYTNNMIKESIRMGHRDLGDFYRAIGDHATALKHYTKSRESCTTSQHVLDMSLSVLELLIEQKNYSHIPTYVFKAEAALEAANTASVANSGSAPAGAAPPLPTKKSPEREKVQTKLDFATALAYLGQGNYKSAATSFSKVGAPSQLGDWIGRVIAPGDIAIYGTLCALAGLSRSEIKSQILWNTQFSMYIEQEPYVRELLEAYMSSSFKTVLELLARYSTRHHVDIHLTSHVQELTHLIRNATVVLYFQPFASIKLERMSAAFGWTTEEVERHVVALIQSGSIQGRVDSQNKILRAKKTDHRTELFARATKAASDMRSANRKLLLRMMLQQADIVVRAPKGSGQGQGHGFQSASGIHPGDLVQGD